MRRMTSEMRSEIKSFMEARNEGFLSDEDFLNAVAIICSMGWDEVDQLTKDYFCFRLQGCKVADAIQGAIEANE